MFSVIVNKPNKNNLISTADDCSKIASLKALIKLLNLWLYVEKKLWSISTKWNVDLGISAGEVS